MKIKHILEKTRTIPSNELISPQRQQALLAEDRALQQLIETTLKTKGNTDDNA